MLTAFEFEYLDSYFHFDQVEPDSLSDASMEPTQISAKKAELHVPLCGCDSGVPGYLCTQETKVTKWYSTLFLK